MPNEGVLRPLEELDGCSRLHHFAKVHHHHLVSEGERLRLVMRHVDHGALGPEVQFLELGTQLPLEVRIDHREGLVEHDDVHVRAHQATAERYLLLSVGGEAGGALVECLGQLQHVGDLGNARLDLAFGNTPVPEREGEVVEHRHGVIDDRELEHLRDVAFLGRTV